MTLSKSLHPFSVRCPYCLAVRRQPCVRMGPSGWERAPTHKARWERVMNRGKP